MPVASPRTTVYVHIGPPKTGTTYIQGVLRYWRAELRKQGVLYPAAPVPDHFHAALDVRGRHAFGFGRGRDTERPRAHGAWQRLVETTLAHKGVVVISHELLATADREHAARALADLAGADVHVIATVRDPARQLVSAWQERVKHGSPRRFRQTARQLRSKAGWRGAAQDLPSVLDTWGQGLPGDHVHVVTVPPSGADPTVLWDRFASVIGVDAGAFDPSRAPRTNESLGIAEVEVLRRVNQVLAGRIPHPTYGQIVTTIYANQILAGNRGSPSPVMPKGLRTHAEVLAEEWIGHIKDRGYDVRGDLDELRPHRREGGAPSRVSERAVADAAVRATADLLVTVAELRQPRYAAQLASRTVVRRVGYATFSAGHRARLLLHRRGRGRWRPEQGPGAKGPRS
jgi:hypothetical protein